MRLVLIKWADAIDVSGWHSKEEAIRWAETDDWIVSQVGWVLEETDDYILLSSKYNHASDDRDTSYGFLLKIPKPWIESITELIIKPN